MFRFRLERVLQHRCREVDARSREVAAAQHVLQEAEQRRDEAQRQLLQCRADSAARRQEGLDATALEQAAAWQQELAARCRACEELVAGARRNFAAAREGLQQAWRDREVLERLRERQRLEWEQEQARRERRALDEIGAIRAALAERSPGAGADRMSSGGE
jgi:flagellar export protein FliJ